jgi:hypothetical protein
MNIELATIKADKDNVGQHTAKLLIDGHHVMNVRYLGADQWPSMEHAGHKRGNQLYDDAVQDVMKRNFAHLHDYVLKQFGFHFARVQQEEESKRIQKLIKTHTVYYVYLPGQDISKVPLSEYTIIETKYAPKVAKHLKESYALFDKEVYILNERFDENQPTQLVVPPSTEGQLGLGLAA